MQKRKISAIQTFMLLTMTNAVTNHVLIIPMLLGAGQRDAWLSGIVAAAPACLAALCLFAVLRTTDRQPLQQWLSRQIGKLGAGIVTCFFALYLLSLIYISLKDTATWVSVTFLPYTPQVVTGGLLAALCFAAAYKGLWSITICAGALLPPVVLLGWFVMYANFRYKDYSLLTPMLAHGMMPVWKGALYATSGVIEVVLILLLSPHMNQPVRRTALLIYVLIAVSLMVGPTAGSLANFGPAEAIKQRYPAYEQWRLVSLGKYVNHLDFFSIFQWLSGTFVRISLFMFLLPDLLQIRRPVVRLRFLAALAAAMIALLMLPVSDMQFFHFLQNDYYPAACAAVSLVLLALLLLSWIARIRHRRGLEHAGDNE